jgi:hypothetical protein
LHAPVEPNDIEFAKLVEEVFVMFLNRGRALLAQPNLVHVLDALRTLPYVRSEPFQRRFLERVVTRILPMMKQGRSLIDPVLRDLQRFDQTPTAAMLTDWQQGFEAVMAMANPRNQEPYCSLLRLQMAACQ